MEVLPPSALIIAAKRSGTNFVHDVLSIGYQANMMEPIGLHNEGQSPLHPWRYSGKDAVSKKFGHTAYANDPYGAMVTRDFLSWISQGGKLIKETDPFPLPWLLDSVPLKVLSIYRDPRDSIASFKRGDLYTKWDYEPKMTQLVQTVKQNPDLAQYEPLMPKNITTLPRHQQLAYYYGLVHKEIQRNIQGQNVHQTTYDELTTDPMETFRQIATFLEIPFDEAFQHSVREHTTQTKDSGIHGTYKKAQDINKFTRTLTLQEEGDIRAICKNFGLELERPLGANFSLDQWPRTTPEQKLTRPVVKRDWDAVIKEQRKTSVEIDGVWTADTLVTNEQYAQFLYWLRENNIPNEVSGKFLFYNDRPQSNIHNQYDGFSIDAGKADHPVMMLSWLGAKTFAFWSGGRLQRSEEWQKIASSTTTGNYDQKLQGTSAVREFLPNELDIYDAVGNVAVWTEPKPEGFDAPFAGVAFSHVRDIWQQGGKNEAEQRRFFWLSTPSIGMRVVFDDTKLVDKKKIKEQIELLTSELTQNPDISLEKIMELI